MAKKQMSIDELVLERFGGTRQANFAKGMSDDMYIGWCAAISNMQNLGSGFSPAEFIDACKRNLL